MANYEQDKLPMVVSQTQSIKEVRKMFKTIAKYGSVLVIIGLLTACAGNSIFHGYFMRGQVVDVEENEVVLCIGSKDGAKEGQTLDVYRFVVNKGATQEGDDPYRRNYIGEVVIGSVVNEHFARASVNSGEVKLHDVVELKQ